METLTPESVGLSSARLCRITSAMQSHIDSGRLPGVITMVARRGNVAHSECLGSMDLEVQKPVRVDTIFNVASMVKPITSAALMMLFEEGRLQLSDPVSRFIPAFKDIKILTGETNGGPRLAGLERKITIHDLLTHTAGLVYGVWEESPVDAIYREANVTDSERTLEEFVQELVRLPLAWQPGTRWQYSVANDVVAYLIQLVSGRSFDAFLEERIFQPLGMVDTGFFVPQSKIHRLATAYSVGGDGSLRAGGPPTTSRYADPRRAPRASSGLLSTASDYMRFCQMMLNGGTLEGERILGRKTVELMTMNHLPLALLPLRFGPFSHFLEGYGFGLGCAVMLDPARAQSLGSAGAYWWFGVWGTSFFIDPREELIGLLMAQVRWSALQTALEFKVLVYQAVVD